MKVKSCNDVKSLLPAYFNDTLNADVSSCIKEHLAICPNCQKELDFIAEISEKTSKLPTQEPSSDFTYNLHQKLLELQNKKIQLIKKKKTNLYRLSVSLASVAAVLVISIVSFNSILSKTERHNDTNTTSYERQAEPSQNARIMPDMAKSRSVQVDSISLSLIVTDENFDEISALLSDYKIDENQYEIPYQTYLSLKEEIKTKVENEIEDLFTQKENIAAINITIEKK